MPVPAPHLLKSWRDRLSQRLDPSEMAFALDEIFEIAGSSIVTYGPLKFAREAWVANKLAQQEGANAIWCLTAERPDIGMLLNGDERLFEVTEILEAGRQRGAEYARLRAAEARGEQVVEDDPQEQWEADVVSMPTWLRQAAERKANKIYDDGCSLLIYLNRSVYGFRQAHIEKFLAPATRVAGEVFREVWILFDGRCHLAWRDGQRVDF